MSNTGLKQRPLLRFLYHTLWGGLDWIYPPSCGGCNRSGWRWCPTCRRDAQSINFPVCPICSLLEPKGQVCNACLDNPPPFKSLKSWGVYRGVLRSAILRMKYHRDIGLSEEMSHYLGDVYRNSGWKVDMVVPIPLGRARHNERGYNQANLISFPFAWAANLSYQPGAVIRIRDTASQVGLTAQQRKQNVENAFKSERSMVNHKTILLIDDVATTCSTLISASQALVDAGAFAVYCLTLARADRSTPDIEPIPQPD